jgi:hypothetical protein
MQQRRADDGAPSRAFAQTAVLLASAVYFRVLMAA